MKSLILLGRVSYYLVVLMMICVISQHPFLEAEADEQPNPEAGALLAFSSSVTDPLDTGVYSSWNPSQSPCTWFHITCNNNNKIIRIDLGNSNLSGQLVADLAQLTELEYLELYGNQLTGSIPAQLANFTHMKEFYLYNNHLSGCLPSVLIKAYGTILNTKNNPDLCSPQSNSPCNC